MISKNPNENFFHPTIFFKAGLSNLKPIGTNDFHASTIVSILEARHLINCDGHKEKSALSTPLNIIVKK